MKVSKKDRFCYKCSLPSNSKRINSLHLHKNAIRSNKSNLESNKPISSDENSNLDNQIASGQNEKKTFKCELHIVLKEII